MSGLEFLDRVPFSDVYITSVVQAPDGRRMSKSLGTGIDPLKLIETHGADALRFGLLAMSSSQDVRFSEAKVQQGRDLANKLWNASRLILLNAGGAEPEPATATAEDRWILSRLERTVELVGDRIDAFDFAHAALELYRLRVLRSLRLVSRDRQAAPLRRPRAGRPQRRGEPPARARAHPGDGPPPDAVRDRGDLELPAGPPLRADRRRVSRRRARSRRRRRRGGGRRGDRADQGVATLARAGGGLPGDDPERPRRRRRRRPSVGRAPGPARARPRGATTPMPLRSPRSGRSRSSLPRASTRTPYPTVSTSSATACGARSSGRRASWPIRASSRTRRPRWSRPSGRSWSATAPSWMNWPDGEPA